MAVSDAPPRVETERRYSTVTLDLMQISIFALELRGAVRGSLSRFWTLLIVSRTAFVILRKSPGMTSDHRGRPLASRGELMPKREMAGDA